MGKARVLGLIAEGEIVTAIDHLIEKHKNNKDKRSKNKYYDFILLRSQLVRANKEYHQRNILEYEVYERIINKITHALIVLIDKKSK